jgi:precorrin-2 dehydrogenase/sirohydrochlorin ferrochelatase
MANYYPIYIDLDQKPVLVVGGGTVACRKVETLLAYGALVRIVSPKITPALERMIDGKRCRWHAKEYDPADMENVVLVFSCTEKEEVNARVALDAQTRNIFLNVVDDPQNCSFLVPAVLRRGDLAIAVSTGGSSPLAARRLREELETRYGDEMAAYLELLKAWREKAKKELSPEQRRELWEKVTDGEVLSLVREKKLDRAKEVIAACFQSLSE